MSCNIRKLCRLLLQCTYCLMSVDISDRVAQGSSIGESTAAVRLPEPCAVRRDVDVHFLVILY